MFTHGRLHEGSRAIVLAAQAYASRLMAKSRSITHFLEHRMASVCVAWLAITMGLAVFRLARPASPIHNLGDALPVLLAYSLVIAAPVVGYLVARHAFKGDAAVLQPSFRFALVGRWRKLSHSDAAAQPAFGPVGFMASLLIGMLLNVIVRTFEFFTAVPAMSYHAPAWGQALFAYMALDLILCSFFYMVAFVMALRTIPLFPRMLLFAWLLDVTMQLTVARELAVTGGVPDIVVEPLLTLLDGNITKVLISAVVWLPYLLLSERVNVTYRHRTDARL
jgi:hypothetical protein